MVHSNSSDGAIQSPTVVYANIEMFTVLPALQGQVFDDSTWQVKIHDEGLPTKFHYKITYVG